MNNSQIEIEFKWSAHTQNDFTSFLKHARKLRAKLKRPLSLRICDYYLDTPNRFFGHQHMSCRLRLSNHRWELTLKTRTSLKEGLAKRKETRYSLPKCESLRQALKYTQGKILSPFLNHKPLKNIFQIRNQRTKRKIILPGGIHTEACFDNVKISRGRRIIRMQEIELEFLKGNLKSFKSFTRKMTRNSLLKPTRLSKVATALKTFFPNVRT